MDAYTGFAAVYDLFMDNIPYEEWADYIHGLLVEYGIKDGLVLDLGCGTGSLTEIMDGLHYDMIGVDCSEDMLEIAMEKRVQSGRDILYLLQDMRGFELYGTVRAVVSVCDSLNYITSEEELLTVFKLVNNYLDPGGIFLFDLNTEYKYRELMGERVFAEDREDSSFIWDNCYYEDEEINEYDLSIFVRGKDGRYDKYEETHYQKAYSIDTVEKLLSMSGLQFVAAYDAFSREAPKEDSERIYVIARECQKNCDK